MLSREWHDVSRRWVMALSSTLLVACPLFAGPDRQRGDRDPRRVWSDTWIESDAALGQGPRFTSDAGQVGDAQIAQDASADADAITAEDADLVQDAGPIVSARGTLLDARDGQGYATVTLGLQTWMAQSLNYGPQQLGITTNPLPSDDAKVEKYCLEDDPEQCRRVGGLYSWPEALALPASCVEKLCAERINRVHQGICPLGWHVPSYDEWSELALYLAQRLGLVTGDVNLAWPFVAPALKSTELWTPSAAGSNESGFGALPSTDWVDIDVDGGTRKGAHFVSSEEQTEVAFTGPGLFEQRAGYSSFGKGLISSLRCVADR